MNFKCVIDVLMNWFVLIQAIVITVVAMILVVLKWKLRQRSRHMYTPQGKKPGHLVLKDHYEPH